MSKTLHSRLGRLWDRHLGTPLVDQTTGKLDVRMTRAQQYVIEKSGESAWAFLTARDPETNRPLIWTKDEADKAAPLKPFPSDLKYVREYLEVLEYEPWVLVDKSRQMYVTTSTMLFIHWHCLFRIARRCLLSKSTEKEAKEILKDKVRFPHSQMPLWAQQALPITSMPQRSIRYIKTGSILIGAAQNVAETEARGGTCSIMFIDEAARQQKYRAIVAGATPMIMGKPGVTGGQLYAATTPDVGSPGAKAFKADLDDKEDAA